MTHPALDAVGELIRPHKERIQVTPLVAYTVTAPCLLAQLAAALTVGSESGGRGIPGSRATINVDVSDLWFEMATAIYAWAEHLGVARRDPQDHHPIPWIGRLLRTTATHATSRGEDDMADRIRHNAQAWRGRIETLLTGQAEQRGIRGAACPECGVSAIKEQRDEGGRRETFQVPAIVLVVREVDGQPLRWLVCQACGWSQHLTEEWTSESLEHVA